MEKKPNSTGEYIAPEVNVIELLTQGILCASTTDMPIDDNYPF